MKRYLSRLPFLTATMLASLCCLQAGAEFGGKFPGKGDNLTWQKANYSYNEGTIFFKAQNYDKAIEKYNAAIAIYPYDAQFFNYLGLSQKKKGNWSAAETALRQAISLNGSEWSSWSNLGSVLKHQNRAAEAKEAYCKALQLNPPSTARVLLQQNVASLGRAVSDAPPTAPPATSAVTSTTVEASSSQSAPPTVTPSSNSASGLPQAAPMPIVPATSNSPAPIPVSLPSTPSATPGTTPTP